MLILLSTFHFTAQSQPQNQGIRFILKDSLTNVPIPYAAIAVLDVKSNSMVDGGMTEEDGVCVLKKISVGSAYTVKVSSVGYKTITKKNFNITQNLVQIPMTVVGYELKEAVVVAEKSAIVQNIDKKVVNIEQLVSNKNGTLGEVLANIPSISIDQDGNISMRGSQQINVMIDGKPTTMSMDALQQLPATSVESVELITNPSAKYDASGTAGILNIISKKSRNDGYNGTVTLGVSTRNKYNGNINLNTKKRRLSTNLNLGYRYNENNNYNDGERIYATESNPRTFYINGDGLRIMQNLNAKAGLDFAINKHHSIYVNAGANTHDHKSEGNTYYKTVFSQNGLTTEDSKIEEEVQDELNLEAGAGYKITFQQPKHFLSFDFYRSQGNEDESSIYNYYYDDNIGSFNSDIASKAIDDLFNIQIDYSLPIQKNIFLESGLRRTHRSFDIDATQSQVGNSIFRAYNFTFDYEDLIHAAYAALNIKKDKWGYNVGLRYEDTQYDFDFASDTSITEKKQYGSFFPSAFVSYAPNQDWSHQIGYSKRINRPGIRSLNPYQDINDPYSIREGNPNLKPEYIHSIELNSNRYTKWGSLGTSLYYRRTVNSIVRFVSNDTATNVTTIKLENSDELNNYGLDLNLNIKATSIWNIIFSSSLFNSELKVDDLNRNILISKSNVISTWKVFPSSELQISGKYSTPFATPQGKVDGFNSIDISWKQKILKNKGTLILSVNDIFDTQKFHVNGVNGDISYNFIRKRESRIANLSFTYNFGTLEFRGNKKKQPELPSSAGDGGF